MYYKQINKIIRNFKFNKFKNHIFIFLIFILIILIIQNIFFKKPVKEGLNVNKLEREIKDVVGKVKKLPSAFKKIGDALNKGIVKPMNTLFTGIGNVFEQVFKIFEMIGDKIVSLPNCILTYAFKSTLDNTFYVIESIYKYIIPKFLRDWISFFYRYTIGIIINFCVKQISYYSGYDAQVNKCYGFSVKDQVASMNKSFTKINQSFKNDFGKMDFGKIM
jgi:hypothetical protein